MKDARNLKPGDKVYSTAKFLTRGIVEKVFSRHVADAIGDWIVIETEYGVNDYLGPNDWYLTIQDAERRALDLVHLRLQSLSKQRRKLEVLRDGLLRSTGDGK